MFTTPNMGLVAWDQGDDPYDHSQLAGNFSQIDQHNHTGGKGVQIPTAGLVDGAVTSDKIGANAVNPTAHIPTDSIPQSRLGVDSVGNSELQDNAVGTANIIDGAVTSDKLDPSIRPVGEVALWYRADASVLPPASWEIMDGRAWSTIPNKLGAGGTQWNTGNIPNMTNRFPLGAALAGTGVTPELPPDIGATGGAHERDLSHTHTSNAHSHTVNSHQHGITAEPDHSHGFWSTGPHGVGLTRMWTRDVGVPQRQGTRQAAFVPAHNWGSELGSEVPIDMELKGGHSHGGTTDGAVAGTSSVAAVINSGLTGDQDLRPGFVGLLFLMKVR